MVLYFIVLSLSPLTFKPVSDIDIACQSGKPVVAFIEARLETHAAHPKIAHTLVAIDCKNKSAAEGWE